MTAQAHQPPPSGDKEAAAPVRRKLRIVLALFIAGLVVSGVTAFPLLGELNFVVRTFGLEGQAAGNGPASDLARWVVQVRDGLRVTYDAYPFVAYGTDWLAFGHIIIALFFIGPMIDPVRNVFVLHAGLLACVLVLPLALLCGAMREIPIYWRLVDCSFGIGGLPFLWYALKLTRQLAAFDRRHLEPTKEGTDGG